MAEITHLRDAELEAMEARAKAATPGPWYFRISRLGDALETALNKEDVIGSPNRITDYLTIDPRNGDFIAHAREDIPRLIAIIKQQQEIIDSIGRINEQLNFCQEERDALRAQLAKVREIAIDLNKNIDFVKGLKYPLQLSDRTVLVFRARALAEALEEKP